MLSLYNTLTRKKEEFKAINSPQVGLYCCGPTVYDYQHIGNMRTYIFEDILRRTLEYNGYKVKHIINITDIGHLVSDADEGEDKMMKALRRENLAPTKKSMLKIAQKYTKAFQEDLRKLNIKEPNKYTRATKHIKEQIKLVQTLIDQGYTYETKDGIYFDTTKYPEYGRLALLDKQELQAGKRIDLAEKKDIHDFALWKFSQPNENRIMEWPAFDKMGFPGWHAECSAMSQKYLGQHFDIHCGGIDHIPVHHTNERAQNNCAAGIKECVNYWMHGEFLVLTIFKNNTHVCPNCGYKNLLKDESSYKSKKEKDEISLYVECQKCKKSFSQIKMSKSDGGFIILQDIIEKGFNPLVYRLMCLGTHYRKPLSYSETALKNFNKVLNNIISNYQLLLEKSSKKKIDITDDPYLREFKKAINNDMNMPVALSQYYEVITNDTFHSIDERIELAKEMDKIIGLNLNKIKKEKINIPTNVKELAKQRLKARIEKNWTESDRLRDKINKAGWNIEDTGNSYVLKKEITPSVASRHLPLEKEENFRRNKML